MANITTALTQQKLDDIIHLDGGVLVTGMALVFTTQNLWAFGVSFNVLHDKKRQSLMNAICFVGAVASLISYPLCATGLYPQLNMVLNFIILSVVLFGIAMMNHNSLILI